MKTISTVLLLLFLALPAFGQPMNSLPSAPTLPTNYIFVVENPSIKTWKSTINTLINTMRSNLVASGVGTNVSYSTNLFLTGSNTVAAGLNVTVTTNITSSNVTFTVGTKSNISFYAGGNEMVLGTWGDVVGISNVTRGELAMWLDEPDLHNEVRFQDGILVGGVVVATNVQLTAIPGTGTNVGITAVGQLFRTTVSGDGSSVTISNANILWVDKGGTNGVRGKLDRPYPHPTHAWSNAVAGDTVVVLPGTYHGCSNLMKAGVNWQGIGWPMLTYTNRTNDRGTGIFDERFSGATTSIIDGFNFIYSTGLPGTNTDGTVCCTPTNISFAGALVVTNPASMVDFTFGDIDFVCLPEGGGSQCINVQNTRLSRVKGRSLRDLFYYTNYYVGLDDVGGAVYWPSSAEGVYWEQGNLHVEIDSILMAKFSIFGKAQEYHLNGTNNNLFVKLNSAVGSCLLLTVCTNPPDWNTDITIKSLVGSTNQSTFGVGTGIGYSISGGGAHRLNAGTIANGFHRVAPLHINGLGHSTPRVKINANKVAFQVGVKDNDADALMCSIAAGIVDLNVVEWEDTGGATAGLNLTGGSTTVSGGRLTVTNGTGVRLGIGATARLNNMVIDTSTTSAMTNTPVFVSTNGLILNNCVLVAPTAAPVIMATSAKSVLVYGVLTSNKTNSPNVTTQVGSQIVDANVR